MKSIENLRDNHKGKIWIIGASPLLDQLPKNFFDDKISIAINETFRYFPNCTYILFSDKSMIKIIINEYPQFLKKSIFMWPVEAQYRNDRIKAFGGKTEGLIYMNWARDQSSNEHVLRQAFQKTVDSIMKRQPFNSVAYATNLHNAIEVAAIMGAKKISLVACEAKIIGDYFHAEKVRDPSEKMFSEYPPEIQKSINSSFIRFSKGTKWLAEMFKPYRIEVRRYDYSKGYEDIK